ncbi:MAG: multidrug effflux MFS transporter [Gammaproteobacteria bacterium]|nr:multidrug effflux MFS transporter [Gammaproteobacteria bacterium]
MPTTSNALGIFETKRGAASAVYGGSQQLIAFLTSAIVGAMAFEGVWLLALAYMLLGLTGLVVFFMLISKQRTNVS